MASDIQFRLIVQKLSGDKNKYYPDIINGTITFEYPLKIPTCNLTVNLNGGESTSSYLSPITADDIVRVQINYKIVSSAPDVWVDLFEGRLSSMSGTFSKSDNNTKIKCIGHENALAYTYTTSDKTYTSQTTGYIINDLMSLVGRYTDASPSQIDQTNSTVVTGYTIKKDSKSVAEVIADLEKIELDNYSFKTGVLYDSDGNLSSIYPIWQPLASTDTLHINEGSRSLISASFDSDMTRMRNKITVYGGAYSATAEDTVLQVQYDTRFKPMVDNSLDSTAACQEIADALLARWKNPVQVGTVKIKGNLGVRTGDKVPCRIASIILNGEIVDDEFSVRKLTHTIGKEFTSALSLGENDMDMAELMGILITTNRRNNLNTMG